MVFLIPSVQMLAHYLKVDYECFHTVPNSPFKKLPLYAVQTKCMSNHQGKGEVVPVR
jgi:hypothetical protein